jgi:hypothetical protein
VLQDKEEIKNRWTEYCRTLYQNQGTDEDTVFELERLAPPPLEDKNDSIHYEEVVSAIKRLKPMKSTGTDEIAGEMIQAGGEVLAREIHSLCDREWREGQIPEEWTRSVLVIIPKKRDVKECNNYRTTALFNHMCKVLMMVLLGETQSTGGALSCGRTSRIQERPQYDTTYSDAPINCRQKHIGKPHQCTTA